ncbi:MAG TPA: hypothetical protein PKO15_04915 [Fibrobacteria bacterium]|nr:hypothetical protein [Fibrobacteria bacterium]HOX51588.1 hypothetical protein [Fibrobacteria bacterium]
MKRFLTTDRVGNILLAKGILTLLLGILHVIGAFTFEAASIAGAGTATLRRDYLIWFGGVGFFILFLGVLDLLCHRPLRSGNPLARRIASLDAAATALIGSAGIHLFGTFPPFPVIVAALGWIPLAFLRIHGGIPETTRPT